MRNSLKRLMNLLASNRQEIVPFVAWWMLIIWPQFFFRHFTGTLGYYPGFVAFLALIIGVGRYVAEGVDFVKHKREIRAEMEKHDAIVRGVNEIIRDTGYSK